MTLNDVNVDIIHADAPVRFLFAHAIELYLKAYLLLKGVKAKELRSRTLGHDLKLLMAKAVEKGLIVSQEHLAAVELANEAIRDRYIETGFRTVLLPEDFSSICSNLHEQIGPAVYLAVGLTREPTPFRPETLRT